MATGEHGDQEQAGHQPAVLAEDPPVVLEVRLALAGMVDLVR